MRAKIIPVSFNKKAANALEVRSGPLGPPPSFYFAFQDVTPEVPAVPAVKDADGNTVTPEVPAIPESVKTIFDGNVTMKMEQWNAWDEAENDEAYQLKCVAELVEATLA